MMMTEKQTWLTIAEALATPREERTLGGRCLNQYCICYALTDLVDKKRIDRELYGRMEDDLREHNYLIPGHDLNDRTFSAFFCDPAVEANDLLRADFCYMQYYMLGGE